MNAPSEVSLDRLQRWMQTLVAHPGGVAAGAELPEARAQLDVAPEDIERVIRRSQALTATERLEIYNRAYFARLLECLREEYPVLTAALGDDLFDEFALGYLQQHPSTSYTLADLGAKLPEYLAATRPGAAENTDADWPAFMIDLARLERTVSEVFDGPGIEGVQLLAPESLRAIPPDRWPDVRLECVPCLRLLQFSCPVNDCYTAIRRKEPWQMPERGPAFIAVTRREFRVYRHPLTAPQHAILASLLTGECLGSAIAAAATFVPANDDRFGPSLERWFFEWTASGFFRRAVCD